MQRGRNRSPLLNLLRGVLLVAGLSSFGCRQEPTQPMTGVPTAVGRGKEAAQQDKALPGLKLTIETGAFLSGTLPGRFGRVPQLEPRLSETKLGSYKLEAHLYGEPEGPPLRVASAERASRLCSERQGRLCSELEWERACKGEESVPFPTGEEWNCAEGSRCSSGAGAIGMGQQLEWTASTFGTASSRAGRPVLRGAAADAKAELRRCARRKAAGKGSKGAYFRCCYGAPNSAQVKEPEVETAYEFATLTSKRLTELLGEHPETADIAKEVSFFSAGEAVGTVIARGPGDRKGFLFTSKPLLWRPVAGAEFLVVAARSGKKQSFVAAFHTLPQNRFALASSFIMDDESGPIVLAYSQGIRPRLHFSQCWGCPGETGKLLYRKHDRVVILQP